MSLQFSRSLRSLRVDSFRASRFGLILATLNMIALITWFFMAKVTIYETSPAGKFTQEGRLLAEFAPEAIERIQPGQAAVVRINLNQDQRPLALDAVVFSINQSSNQVEFLVYAGDLPLEQLAGKQSGVVQIEVEHISPAALVMRASGKFLNNSQVPLSPQTTPLSE